MHPQNVYPHVQSYPAQASPPMMQNGHAFQPQMQSTPSIHMHRSSMSRESIPPTGPNGLPQVSHPTPPTAPPSQPQNMQNGYAYVRSPPVYNPQAAVGMPVHPAQGTPDLNQQPQYAYAHPEQHPAPQSAPAHQQQHPQHSQPPYIEDDRGSSIPPTMPSFSQTPETDPNRLSMDTNLDVSSSHVKSKSIYTPVAAESSVLAAHWGGTTTPDVKTDRESRNQPAEQDRKLWDHKMSPPAKHTKVPPPQSSSFPIQSGEPVEHTVYAPIIDDSRPDASPRSAKPRLKVHIPSEQAENGSVADSAASNLQSNAANGSAATASNLNTATSRLDTGAGSASTSASSGGPQSSKSATAEGGSSHSSSNGGVVLPPPSPSGAAILSAGAQGPVNPFARPHPPQSAVGMDTPMSALPSRYIESSLLPSPSSFFAGDWNIRSAGPGGSGLSALEAPNGGANVLPSPLGFQSTPITNDRNNSFGSRDGKRESSAGESDKRRAEDPLDETNRKKVRVGKV
jgi:MADS-box transcription factor